MTPLGSKTLPSARYFLHLAIIAAAVSAPFAVSGAMHLFPGMPVTLFFLAAASVLLGIFILNMGRISIPLEGRLVVLLLFLPFLMSLLIGVPVAILVPPLGIDYQAYPAASFGRIVNFIMIAFYFVGVLSFLQTSRTVSKRNEFAECFVRAYWYGTSVFVLVGVWQLFHFYTEIPYPFPDTRTHIHSVPDALRNLVPGRLTSLANEPSFFAPIIIDFALLTLLLIRKILRLFVILAVSFLLLIFSFSVGGYLNILILGLVLMLTLFLQTLYRGRIQLGRELYISIFSVIGLIGFIVIFISYAELVTVRLGSALDTSSHARAFMVIMPFYWIADSAFVNILLGHGPKAYSLIGQVVSLPISGQPVHVTSNCMYSDILWEHGIVGLTALFVLFAVLAVKTRALVAAGWERTVALLLIVHLFSSSLYRADFYSLRFFVILLIVIMIIKGYISGKCKSETEKRG